MNEDEWYEKLREWAREDRRLGKLPFALMTPLAEHLASYEAVEQTRACDNHAFIAKTTGFEFCPQCGLPLRTLR
jgi:hypothetical protein